MAAYGISYGIVDGKTLNKREVVPKFMEAEGFTIRKLKEGTQYWFKVQAIYEEFAGPWSEKVEGTTGKPQPPVNFTVDKNTKAAKWFVNVSWENNPLNDERKLNIEEYRVKCWDSNNPTSKYEKTFTAPTKVSTKGVLETSGKVNYVCSVQVKTDKGTLSEVKQSGVLAFDDIEKPAVSKRSERWGTTITLTKVAEHSYTLKDPTISGVVFDKSTGQVTATEPAANIIIVATRKDYTGSVESDPIEFTRQAGSTLKFANIDVEVEYGKGNTHTQTVTNDRVVAGDTGVVSYSISPTGAGASIDTGSGKVDFTVAAIGTTFTITARKAQSAKYEAQTASYQLTVQANTNTGDITKPAVSKRSERWGNPITVRKVADHSYTLKQAITGVAFDKSIGQVTATQAAARIIIVAKRTGYAGSVESDPIEFIRQAGSTLSFANTNKNIMYATGGNSYTQTATNDRSGSGDTRNIEYSISPTGASASVNTGSGKVTLTPGAIGTTFTITARKAESAKYEAQTASYRLTVAKLKPANKAALQAEIRKAIGTHGNNVNLNYIDTSDVTDMSWLFKDKATFNGDISKWNTSKVTNMIGMFMGAKAFNQPLNNWNVSKVTNMQAMFLAAEAFNQSLTKWNTSKVTNMQDMFDGATVFNQPLDSWIVSSVTNMSYMFRNANAFNQSLTKWNTSKVTNMSSMFRNAKAFNQSLNKWNTSKVTNMSSMFNGAKAFNQSLNKWNTSKVTNMSSMFKEAKAFNQPLNKWNTSSVTDMSAMFDDATIFNQSLNSWTVSSVTDMNGMFRYASSFNQPLDTWDVSRVTDMSQMFYGIYIFNQDISSWAEKIGRNIKYMFTATISMQRSNKPRWAR